MMTAQKAMLMTLTFSLFFTVAGIAQCNNVTWGGAIGSNQTGNVGYNPSTFLNVNSPSGGSGSMEYMWLYKNSSTDWQFYAVNGANSATYDCPAISETTTFRRCARRTGCSTWDGESNDVTVTINCNTCDNLTSGGTIGSNQSGCSGFDAAPLTNVSSPSGGSGALEIIWMYWNASTGWNMTQVVNASGLTYDPGLIHEDTYFRRCSRRQGCSSYVGESNDIFIDITECCNATIDQVNIYNLGNGTSSGLVNGGTYYAANFPANWNIEAIVSGSTAESVVFDWSGSYSNDNTENVVPFRSPSDNTALNLGAGTYTLTVKLYSADNAGGTLCDEEIYNFTINACDNVTNGGQIGYNQSGCVGFDPSAFESLQLPTGGSGNIEYMWIYKNASTNNVFEPVAGANGATYDAGPVYETTTFRRCARRSGCSSWDGESQDVVITITGECTPDEICELTGYESLTGRIVWIPNYGTDFRSSVSNGGLHFAKYSNGTAHMYGVVERISNTNHRFLVDVWFENLSTYAEWIADGKLPKDPQLGDEQNWLYYDFSTSHVNTMIGQGSLNGVTLYLSNQDPNYGLQLGNGANALNTNNNGFSAWFSYTGTMTGNGDFNASYNCGPVCNLQVEAGPGGEICYPETITLTSNVTGASQCTIPGVTDCNHTVSSSGGWLENTSASAICGDNAGTKLWTQSGNGTSYIIIDLGTTVAAGTQICVNMKLEHCSNTGTNYSNAKIQASTSANSGFVNLTSSVTFSQNTYQEFCYNLSSAARYIKVSDNGNCAFRVDYVEYTTQGSGNSNLSYSWSGPGIVGANNGPSIVANMAGTYTVTVTDCNGCTDSDTVEVTSDDVPPVFNDQQSSYDLGCTENVPYIQPVATDNNGSVEYSYVDLSTCNNNTEVSCDFRTYTQGGWGAPANGNNPGVYRNASFASAFPQGLTIGCASGNTLLLTTAQAVQDFLPSGSTPSALPSDLVNPGGTYNNVFAGQLVALTLSLGFDAWDANFAGSAGYLGDQVISSGTFAGMTITQVVNIANQVIGGCSNQYTFSQLNDVLSDLNENFDGGSNGGFVTCQQPDAACACTWHRRWTATDLCGNTATFDQYFITGDNEGPQPNVDPADQNVQCLDNVPAAPSVTFTDDCGEVTETWMCEEIEQIDECTYQVVRMWMATDGCNITYVDQIINVHDTIDPEFNNLPENDSVECGSLPTSFVVTASDNCDDNVQVDFSFEDSGSGCNLTRTFTFTATDDCGNMISAIRVFSVYDNEDPILIGVPANDTVECDEIPSAPAVTASDNCDEYVPVTVTEQTTEGCPYTITRTWTATDDCNNSVSATQILTVVDTTYPTLIGVPADMTLECDQIAPEAVVTAADNCDDDMVVSHSAYTTDLVCGSIFTRTWSVTDDCGNTTTATQVITFEDTTDPYVTAGVPAELTIECDEQVPSYLPEFADNCDDTLTVTAISGINNLNACGYDIERAWTATDDCGNAITVYQVIHIIDSTLPELVNVPANTTVECDAVPAPAAVSATDNCSTATVDFEESATVGCPYTITRTWTATDECGNQSIASQTILVVDTTYPVLIGVPADDTVECSNIPAAASVDANDNCADNLFVDYNEEFVPGDSCTYTLVRTWSVTDDCGNMTSASQTLTVTDTIDPILVNVPANDTVECDAIPAAANVNGSDNCDDNVTVVMEETATEGCPYTITRTWTATDNCGNSVSASQVLTVIDTTYPTLIGVPTNMILECDQIAPEAVVTSADNCDDDMVVSHTAFTTDLECGSIFTRTWSVTDDCGNTTTATQIITFEDTTDPYVTAGVPAELTIECDEEAPVYLPEFADNCDDTLTVSAISGINNVNPCGYDIERAWTATDDCGNSITVYQVIHVVDETNPELVGVPANTTVECDAVPAPAAVSATDNCSTATVDFEETATVGCPYTITRTWTATDECGNQSVAAQTILVVDTTNPYIVSNPSIEVVVECGNPIPFEAPVFGDNCDSDLNIYFNEETVSGSCLPGLMRTWVATDNCGNSAEFVQFIAIIDTTDPVFDNLPVSETVQCDNVPSAPEVTASDLCDSMVDVSYTEESTDGCPYTITRTWTAWDDCENMITGTQIITVIDTVDPTLNGVPVNTTIECDQPLPGYNVWASDNCDLTISVQFDADTLVNDCGSVVTRTWSATDDCGNESTASQIINIVDTTDPYVIEGVPAELTIECDMQAPVFTPEFGDNCDLDLAISAISGMANNTACGYDIERSWTATDNCGNSVSISQVIHVVDTTEPELVGVPANTVAECNNIPNPAPVFATDNCSIATVEFTQTATSGCPYTITRTWVATDECGNESTASQIIEVVDTQNPILEGVPANSIVECSAIPSAANVTVSDNCDNNIAVEFEEEIIPVNSCTYTIVRTWSAMDDCGNDVAASQILTVVDTTDPTLVGVPANTIVECDNVPAAALVTGEDNCDDMVVVTFEEEVTVGCPYTITRTWVGVDNCGNDVTSTQVITVVDTTDPILHNVPVNTTLECDQAAPAAFVWATDNCAEDLVVSLDSSVVYNECGFVMTRTWSVADDCENMASATQLIYFTDTTDPIVLEGVPAELTIECDQDEPAYTPVFGDNCDEDLTLTAISGINNVNACGYDIERTWSATDDCGNSVSVSQVIHVVDTTDPILVNVPANDTVECDAVPAPAQVTATDNCSTPSVSMTQQVTEGCPYTITRTWTATDACGNTSVASQVITVIDTIDPILVNNPPVTYSIECGEELPVNNPIFSDNCDQQLTIEFNEETVSGSCPGGYIRTWTATDNCGNSIEFQQIIFVHDTTDPIVVEGVPAELTIECDQIAPVYTPVFSDVCDEELTLTATSSISNQTACGYDIERTWTAEDNCENVTVVTQVIHVIDSVDPMFVSIPADATYECASEVVAPAVVEATDNCDDDVNVQFNEEQFALECGFYLVRTWTATDNCGNDVSASQYIYVIDETSPLVSGVPADITIECDEVVPAAVDFIATDNCDNNLDMEVVEFIIPGECGYQIKRYYNATDDCGNMTSVPQIITVLDTTAPEIEAPADITVNCDAVPAAAELSATDNCDTMVDVTFSEVAEDGCPYTITRTWTAVDDCGNTTIVTQYISVVDEVLPVFDAYLPYTTVECDEVDEYTLTATDNCDAEVEVIVIEESQVSGQCYGSLLRTYQATDNCGNSVTAFQIVDIIDSTSPVIHNVPADATIYCGDEIPAMTAEVYATDNCSMDMILGYSEIQTNDFCPFDIIRTWSVMDNCGNVTEASQTIHVVVEVPSVVDLSAFPNPASKEFSLKFSTPVDAVVTGGIFDITGREIQPIFNGKADAGRSYQWIMNTNMFDAGTYNIRMVVGNEVYNERLVITTK